MANSQQLKDELGAVLTRNGYRVRRVPLVMWPIVGLAAVSLIAVFVQHVHWFDGGTRHDAKHGFASVTWTGKPPRTTLEQTLTIAAKTDSSTWAMAYDWGDLDVYAFLGMRTAPNDRDHTMTDYAAFEQFGSTFPATGPNCETEPTFVACFVEMPVTVGKSYDLTLVRDASQGVLISGYVQPADGTKTLIGTIRQPSPSDITDVRSLVNVAAAGPTPSSCTTVRHGTAAFGPLRVDGKPQSVHATRLSSCAHDAMHVDKGTVTAHLGG